VWLRRNRDATHERPAPDTGPDPGRGRARTNIARALTVLSLLLVTLALVAPDQPSGLTPRAFVRLPLEALVVVALALVLPRTARRLMPWLLGPLLGLLVIVKLLDIGFLTLFDRRFDPIQDVGYAGTGIETLRASIGRSDGNLVVAVVVAVVVALLVFMTLALRRLTRVAADHRRWSLRAVAAAALVWALLWVSGAQLVPHTPLASASAAGLVVHEVHTAWADIRDPGVFAKEIGHDRFRATPATRLLTGLRGKDVVVAFVESYGKVAVQGSDFSPQVDSVLDRGTRQLRAAGFSTRTAFLTSSTFGGISWLAHSTLQSGLWVNSQRRYDQLVKTNRFTLSQAFKRAGWRTVDDVPSNNRAWPQGTSFYHYDKVYDRRDVGYRGPSFAYASMPDQYVLSALQRLELAKAHRRRVFAEVDLVSSHIPWTVIPRMVPWREVGDGSVFKRLPADKTTKSALFNDPARVRAAYGESIRYTMSALISYVRHYGNRHLVLILLGDHQPWTVVSGHGASRDVPISVVTRDPAVLHRIASWGWGDGLRPGSRAPVWPMSAFRDRFLSTFDSRAAAP
jgi:hypothetical protein